MNWLELAWTGLRFVEPLQKKFMCGRGEYAVAAAWCNRSKGRGQGQDQGQGQGKSQRQGQGQGEGQGQGRWSVFAGAFLLERFRWSVFAERFCWSVFAGACFWLRSVVFGCAFLFGRAIVVLRLLGRFAKPGVYNSHA